MLSGASHAFTRARPAERVKLKDVSQLPIRA
jgi:hypothetical protein